MYEVYCCRKCLPVKRFMGFPVFTLGHFYDETEEHAGSIIEAVKTRRLATSSF